ncbi:MAG: hypothetical protein ABI411_13675 [Tahibacter sp.]
MEPFDPISHIENASRILDGTEWPNFHDAIVYSLNFWRGDLRPDENIWIFPTIEAAFELDALEFPYVVDLRFHDCSDIRMAKFDNNNDIDMLSFSFEERGFLRDGITPLLPHVCVTLESGPGRGEPLLTFRCFRIEAIGRRAVPTPPCR